MMALVEAYWPLFLAVFLLGLIVAWLVFRGGRRTTVIRDMAEDQNRPATRNQALIDAPPVAATGPVVAPRPDGPMAQPATNADAPAPAAPPAIDTAGTAGTDDLTRIKGVGPKLVALLGELGVTHFAQIAAWSDSDIDRIDAQLGRFQGRIRRDDWVGQAQLLASGDTSGYEARFGRLEG